MNNAFIYGFIFAFAKAKINLKTAPQDVKSCFAPKVWASAMLLNGAYTHRRASLKKIIFFYASPLIPSQRLCVRD
ncbi:hypothetical protein BJI48_03095 [Helicobacter sp. 11S02596-1]|nr:hypothetical protein BJI48_03095 [Helicobacter sp. 11S02596-1]